MLGDSPWLNTIKIQFLSCNESMSIELMCLIFLSNNTYKYLEWAYDDPIPVE